MSADMGCNVFADVGFLLDDGELACVGLQCDVWKMVVVLLQYRNDGWKERDVELRASLDTGGARKNEVSVVVFGLGEIGGHEVGIAEAGVALDQEQIEGDLS